MSAPAVEKATTLTLWPIFLLEILAFVFLLPIFALAGMGYAPSLGWRNYLLLAFHLYPAYIIVAAIISSACKAKGKYTAAALIAFSPPLISATGFLLYLKASP